MNYPSKAPPIPTGELSETIGITPFEVTSITFVPNQTTRTVTFSDASTDDVQPSYGPYIDNVSSPAKYVIADIDVDSNNDGNIDDYDDPIEMTYQVQAICGQNIENQLTTIHNLTLSGYDIQKEVISSNPCVVSADLNSEGKLELLAKKLGTAIVTYSIYIVNGEERSLVSSDSVSIAVNPITIDLAIDSDNSGCVDHHECSSALHASGPADKGTLGREQEEYLEDNLYSPGKMIYQYQEGMELTPIKLYFPRGFFAEGVMDNYAFTLKYKSKRDFNINSENCISIYADDKGETPILSSTFNGGIIDISTDLYYFDNQSLQWEDNYLLLYIKGEEVVIDNFVNNNSINLTDLYQKEISSIITANLFSINRNTDMATIISCDNVKYFVSTKNSFYDKLIHFEVFRNALASDAIYGRKDLSNLGLQLLDITTLTNLKISENDAKILNGVIDNNSSGFNAGIYHDYISGRNILAFQGSDADFTKKETWNDWVNNFYQHIGWEAGQYQIAIRFGEFLPSMKNYNIEELCTAENPKSWSITGHSLGGGLASAAGVIANINDNNSFPVFTFNAAWLRPETVQNKLDDSQWIQESPDIYQLSKKYQYSYFTEEDILTSLLIVYEIYKQTYQLYDIHANAFLLLENVNVLEYLNPIKIVGKAIPITSGVSIFSGVIGSVYAHFMPSVMYGLLERYQL
ncbi:MAG: hypothetical protein Q4C70_04235 [Planctomycetia bacterium]|nr:hypothetical protein [Planctomycetia bacterium]